MDWVADQKVPGLEMKLVHEQGRTPLIFMEIPGDSRNPSTVLMYGHMDKQPPNEGGWHEGLGPWTPVVRDGKLYGRGGADDGYAAFGAITAIKALKAQNVPHARIVVMIEGCEESGSIDLPYYVDLLKSAIGTPNLVVCLDSGCGNYDQLWLTTSLRGVLAGDLKVEILREGVHSGMASGNIFIYTILSS
jgi:acetylornithine deacetylase/succinyl-diaminopimelate desuccinylase-like protein